MSGLKERMGWDFKVALVLRVYESERRLILTSFRVRWMAFKLRYGVICRSYRRFCRTGYALQISRHFLSQ